MGVSIPLALIPTVREWDEKYSLELDFYPTFNLLNLQNTDFVKDIGWMAFRGNSNLYYFTNLVLVLKRSFLLVVFAITQGHTHPDSFGYSTEYGGYLLSLSGNVSSFPGFP